MKRMPVSTDDEPMTTHSQPAGRIRNDPSTDIDKPVSSQHELELQRFHGWPPWLPTPQVELPRGGDPRLRSMREVSGYAVHATDRDIGRVVDCVVREDSWVILHIVVDTGSWLSSRKILVPRARIEHVNWPKQTVTVAGSSQQIEREGPVYDPAAAIKRTYKS